MGEFEISYEFIQAAAQNEGVVKQLQVVANRIQSRATGLASSDGVDMKFTTEAGIRPGGRPFVNVIGDNSEQEFGSSRTQRRRILGRAGEGG